MIENPALWRLSLLVRRGSIDVLCRREIGEADSHYARIIADKSVTDPAAAVEELVYANPLLLQAFRRVDVLVSGGFSLVTEPGICVDDIDAIYPSESPAITLCSEIDSRTAVYFRLDKGVYNFLRRTFDTVEPCHTLAALGRYYTARSRMGNSGKMYVDLDDASMSVMVLNQFGVAMANCFECTDINDAAYYVLASANTAGFDFSVDEIRVSGHSDRRALIMPLLKKFARNVMPAIFPASAGVNSSAIAAPLPLLILPLCE